MILACFLAGIAASALWFALSAPRGPVAQAPAAGPPAIQLTEGTRAALGRLTAQLEIKYYALLDPASVPDSVAAFALRVDKLLGAYQQAGGGKVKLDRINSPSNANANAALGDGIEPFNQDKGDACYFGIALAKGGRKESLPRLAVEWEPALESDLTRAILRLSDQAGSGPAAAPVSLTDSNALQEVRALIPNPDAVSVEEGTRVLREAAVQEFAAAAREMETQVKEAEQRLSQAGVSEAEQQAAMRQLQQLHTAQSQKLRQIAAKSKAQIAAFQQLKNAPR